MYVNVLRVTDDYSREECLVFDRLVLKTDKINSNLRTLFCFVIGDLCSSFRETLFREREKTL